MKNTKKLTILVLTLVFSIMALALSLRANLFCPKTYAEGESVINKSELLFRPTFTSKTDSNLIVFDEYDGAIKVFDSTYKNKCEIELNNCISLMAENGLIFTLTSDPAIKVFSANDGSLVASILNENKEDNELIGAKRLTLYKASDSKIYCLVQKYKDNINTFELYSLVYQDNNWQFSESRLSLDSSRIAIPGEVNAILITEASDAEYKNIVVCYDNNLSYFVIRPEAVTSTSYELSNLYTSATTTKIDNLVQISKNENAYFGVVSNKKITLLSRSITPILSVSSVVLSNEATEADLDSNFSGFSDETYYSVPSQSKVIKLTFNGSTFDKENVISNGSIDLTDLAAKDFNYFVTTSETKILTTPFGNESEYVMPEGAHFCQTKTIKVNSLTLEGFVYGVFVTATTNYYGYVDSSNLTNLANSTYNLTNVYAYANTQMFKLPSRITDNTSNSILQTFSTLTKLTVVSSKCNNNFNSSVNSFCLVKTENNEYGFVLTARIQAMAKSQAVVENNATVNKETNVYLDDDLDSMVIDVLNNKTRVHVIGKTNKTTNLIKVEYVNDSGDLITGYILSTNINTDGWSVLQIVGLILISFNVVFLLVLFFVKKRINHD